MRSVFLAAGAITLWVASVMPLLAQDGGIHGRVLDSRTNEPIAKATVSVRDRKLETRTSETGYFDLPGIAPGEIELYVTTVGYALVRKKIELRESFPLE